MANSKKNQHFISETYLKNFLNPTSFWIYEKNCLKRSKNPYPKGASNSFLKKWFYSPIGLDGNRDLGLENWLRDEIETPFGNAMAEFKNHQKKDSNNIHHNLSEVSKQAFFKFIVTLMVRTERFMEMNLGLHPESTNKTMRGNGLDPCNKNDRKKFYLQTTFCGKDGYLNTFFQGLSSMYICFVSYSQTLISSDSPVISFNPLTKEVTKFQTPKSIIYFPLTPSVACFLYNPQDLDSINLREFSVDDLNKLIFKKAYKLVMSPDEQILQNYITMHNDFRV